MLPGPDGPDINDNGESGAGGKLERSAPAGHDPVTTPLGTRFRRAAGERISQPGGESAGRGWFAKPDSAKTDQPDHRPGPLATDRPPRSPRTLVVLTATRPLAQDSRYDSSRPGNSRTGSNRTLRRSIWEVRRDTFSGIRTVAGAEIGLVGRHGPGCGGIRSLNGYYHFKNGTDPWAAFS